MITVSFSSILASRNLPSQAQIIVKKYFIFSTLMRCIFMLSSTFYFLYIVELVGLQEAAFLITIGLLLQGLIDYPTGAIGDRIGQKNIIFLSYMLHFLAFASLLFVESFTFLVLVYLGEAVAKSLESGAINSWFDNNYKTAAMDFDSNLEIYKASNFRIEMLIGIFASSMFLLGGLFAYWTARKFIFLVQSIFMLIIGFIVLWALNDLEKKNNEDQINFIELLAGGVGLLFKSPRLLIFIIGSIIVAIPIVVWVELILFSLYYGFTGSDALAGIFRFLAWFLSSIFIGFAGAYTKKLSAKKSLYKMHLIHPFLFFFSFALIIYIFPLNNQLQLIAFILSLLVFSLAGIIHNSSDILKKSLYLELIPNEKRNSFYSLIPTITMLVASPLIYIFGMIITSYGFIIAILILGLIEVIGALIIKISFKLPDKWQFNVNLRPNLIQDTTFCCI